jgi:hypothetical protein
MSSVQSLYTRVLLARVGAIVPFRAFDPHVILMPSMQILSLTEKVMPSRGPLSSSMIINCTQCVRQVHNHEYDSHIHVHSSVLPYMHTTRHKTVNQVHGGNKQCLLRKRLSAEILIFSVALSTFSVINTLRCLKVSICSMFLRKSS